MSDSSSTEKRQVPETERKGDLGSLWAFAIALLVIGVLSPSIVPPVGDHVVARESVCMQNARNIGLLMFQYAADHNGKYPNGKNSTEVFQKLIDEKYLTDPSIFYMPYVPFLGKTQGVEGQPLKSENVCWDVTASVDQNDPDQLPIVFLTGYQVAYIPGGIATVLVNFNSVFGTEPRTWFQWWRGELNIKPEPFPGIAVCYKDNSARFMLLKTSDGSIPNFVPPTFDPKGKTYRQLTPDGPLP